MSCGRYCEACMILDRLVFQMIHLTDESHAPIPVRTKEINTFCPEAWEIGQAIAKWFPKPEEIKEESRLARLEID